MKTYTLLRNNFEYGPFSWKDLKAQKLTATDLLWIEGESTCWLSAGDVVGVENLTAAIKATLPATGVQGSKPSTDTGVNSSIDSAPVTPVVHSYNTVSQATATYPTLAELEKSDIEPVRWKPRRNRITLNSRLLNIPVLLGGVVLLAYLTKKMVDEFGTEPEVADAKAQEISSESLPPNTAAYTARFSAPLTPVTTADKMIDTTFKDIAPAKKTPVTAVVKDTARKMSARNLATTTDVENDVKTSVVKTEAIATEPAKPAVPPALVLTGNEYKVGFLGGVSGVQLTVSNPGNQSVENAVLIVDFLKPNGSVVKTETVQAGPISAGGEAVVAVPSSSRGVKINYRVSSVVAAKGSVTANN